MARSPEMMPGSSDRLFRLMPPMKSDGDGEPITRGWLFRERRTRVGVSEADSGF